MIIAIIGAGAAGMAAAITAATQKDVNIILIEKQSRVGKKLQATGNGRCNLSNISPLNGHYHGEDADFANGAFEQYSAKNTLEWFRSLGLFTISEESGKIYPYSDQANSVVDTLRFALERPNIQLKKDTEILRIRKGADRFILESKQEQISCDRLIIACGGLAGGKLGGSLSGYKLLQSLGHSATRLRPALVQLRADWSGLRALKGVRANCRASIYHENKEIIASEGEIQFTDYGLSGPVIFEISRDACSKSGLWEARLDLLPQSDFDSLYKEILRRKATPLMTDDLLTGILHNRLGRVITKEAGISFGRKISEVDDYDLKLLCKLVKQLKVKLKEPMGMDQAQVTAGGIHTKEFDPHTMESRLIQGLYACGEVLDIDGDCGGFNLQWAWSSGRLAGLSASKKS